MYEHDLDKGNAVSWQVFSPAFWREELWPYGLCQAAVCVLEGVMCRHRTCLPLSAVVPEQCMSQTETILGP